MPASQVPGGGEDLLRAFDKVTGEELWRIDLGARTMGAPMTYLHEGRQFLVVATGGTDRGAEFVALSLPEDL
jgi:quinoprotein glucose dehydrogenase